MKKSVVSQLKPNKSRGGYSMVEMFFVMALLALFGLTTYTLIAVGSNSFQKLMDERESNTDLRVALSYINMKIHQFDTAGALTVESGEDGGRLVLSELIGTTTYNTAIYLRDGKLCEATYDASERFDPSSGFDLVALSGMSIVPDDSGALHIEVWKDTEAGRESLSSVILPRSAEGG